MQENARLWGLFSHSQPGVRLSGQTKPFSFPYQYRQYRPSYALWPHDFRYNTAFARIRI